MVTDEFHPRELIIAEHIWKHSMHGKGWHKFGLTRNDTSSPRNGILVLKAVEDAFTMKYLCFVYNPITTQFVIKVLNPEILDIVIEHSKTRKRFRDVHNTILQHPEGRVPFRRLLSFHARCSYKFAAQKNWITVEEELSYQPYHDLSDGASVPEVV
jgi:hypothetical protein